MKTIIVYSSKHATTKKCAEMLSSKLVGEVTVLNLKEKASVNCSGFDNIIIGSPIYAGSLIKEVKEFCDSNLALLKTKKLGLFVTCMKQSGVEEQINNAYPKELVELAVAKDSFGGGLIYSDMGFIEKTLIKMVIKASAKQNPNEPTISTKQDSLSINERAINLFAERFK